MVGVPAHWDMLSFKFVWQKLLDDKDVVFLVVPDESEFLRHVPLVLGICMLCRLINVIRVHGEAPVWGDCPCDGVPH